MNYMKRVLPVFAILTLLAACANTRPREREVASTRGGCTLEKHQTKDMYRLAIKGIPYNQYWYAKEFSMQMIEKFEKQGKCH